MAGMSAPAADVAADPVPEPGEGGDPTEPQQCQFGDEPATLSLLFRDGEAYTPACADHQDEARAQLAAAGEAVSDVVPIDNAVTAAGDPAVDAGADAGEWRVRFPVMALEGADTSDGRYLTPGTIIARACPLSILAQPFASHGGQEPPPAVVVGRLDTVERVPGPSVTSRVTGEPFPEGTFVWVGHGAVDPSIDVHGLNIGNLLKRRFLNGASVDLAGMDVEMVGDEGFDADPENPRRQMIAHRGEQAAITLVPIPAFGDAYVELVGDDEPMTPADPGEFPDGFAASAFPTWRSAEIGDYPTLTAAGQGSYVEQVRDRIGAELGNDEISGWGDNTERLLDLYTLLALTTGADTTSENVHDAWSVATSRADPQHRSLIPFDQLAPDVQAMDDKYRDAIVAAATDEEGGVDELAVVAAAPSAKQRADAEDDGDTYPGTDKFPIDTRDRAASAVKLHGSSDLPAEKVKAWLIRRLKAKGWDDLIPESWKPNSSHAAQDTATAADPPDLAAADEDVEEPGMPDAPQDCEASGSDTYESEVGPHAAVRSLLFDDRKQYAATCDEHDEWAREQIESRGFVVDGVVEIREPDRLDADEETQP